MSSNDLKRIASEITRLFPGVYGAYLFGSAASGELRSESDVDIALLYPQELVPSKVLQFKAFMSEQFRRDTDIIDLYRADSVTAAQIVSTGVEIVSAVPLKMAEFETMAFSRYALLNEERAEILNDIEKTGTIYSR